MIKETIFFKIWDTIESLYVSQRIPLRQRSSYNYSSLQTSGSLKAFYKS